MTSYAASHRFTRDELFAAAAARKAENDAEWAARLADVHARNKAARPPATTVTMCEIAVESVADAHMTRFAHAPDERTLFLGDGVNITMSASHWRDVIAMVRRSLESDVARVEMEGDQ
jgi:hypothetical protein